MQREKLYNLLTFPMDSPTPFDAAVISALKYVKSFFLLWEMTFKKRKILRPLKNLFLLGTLTVRVYKYTIILDQYVVREM
jgi:hypothetical protein